MDPTQEDAVAKYSAMLKAKVAHLTALSTEQRADLQRQWSALVDEIKAAQGEDPGSPRAQELLNRWASLLQAMTGTDPAAILEQDADAAPFRATPDVRDALWARRAEWLPANTAGDPGAPTDIEAARAQARERVKSFADSGVLDFIKRARAARG